jgi:hypothetical protein
MTQDGQPRTRKPLACVGALGLTLAVGYVLSYAPVVRVCGRGSYIEITQGAHAIRADMPGPLADSSRYPLYEPVDWLIDRTALRHPLFLWAECWGVRKAFEYGYYVRNPLPPFGEIRESEQMGH